MPNFTPPHLLKFDGTEPLGRTVTETFSQGLHSHPGQPPTVLDHLDNGIRYHREPKKRCIELLDGFHGIKGSAQSGNFLQRVAGADLNLRKLAENGIDLANEVANRVFTVESMIDSINAISAGQMSLPMLRGFVQGAQTLHPCITKHIRDNEKQYPYFQKVSEAVGTFYTIASSVLSIDPVFSISCKGSGLLNLKTAARMNRIICNKLDLPVCDMLEKAADITNSKFLKALQCDGNETYSNPNSANKPRRSHGNSHAMDTRHQRRQQESIPEVLAAIFERFGDALRNLNQIFPIDYKVDNRNWAGDTYPIQIRDTKLDVNQRGLVSKKRKPRDKDTQRGKEEEFKKENV